MNNNGVGIYQTDMLEACLPSVDEVQLIPSCGSIHNDYRSYPCFSEIDGLVAANGW